MENETETSYENEVDKTYVHSNVQRKSSVFYEGWHDSIQKLPTNAEKLKAYQYILDYSFYGVLPPEDKSMASIIFNMSKENIISAHNRYDAAVENGKLGGRPKKINGNEIFSFKEQGMSNKEIAEKLNVSTKTIQRALSSGQNQRHNPNDNVNDNVNVNDNSNVNENDVANAPTDADAERKEIEKVLDLYRQGFSYKKDNPEIQQKTDLGGQRIHYIITTYKDDPEYQPKKKEKIIKGTIIPRINNEKSFYTIEEMEPCINGDFSNMYILFTDPKDQFRFEPNFTRKWFIKLGWDGVIHEEAVAN